MDRTQVKPIASFAGWQPQAYMWNPVVLSPLRLGPTLPILERPTQAKFDNTQQDRPDFDARNSLDTAAHVDGACLNCLRRTRIAIPLTEAGRGTRTRRLAWTPQLDLVH